MDRVNGADWYDIGGGKRGFRSQNAGIGVAGTEVTSAWLNDVQENILRVITDAGLTPATGAWNLLSDAIKRAVRGICDFPVVGRQNAPPGSPAVGDIWIVGPAGTGAWAAKNNQIAAYGSTGWSYSSPMAGLQVQYWDVRQVVLRFDGAAWAEDLATTTAAGRVELSTDPEALAGTSTGVVLTPSNLNARLDVVRQGVQFRPHILNGTGRFATTVTTGQIVINAGQRWTYGTIDTFNTDDVPLAERTFAVNTASANEYHLMWYPKGHSRLTALSMPVRDYGGFVLEWLGGASYNPSTLPEADVSFDTNATKMLCGRAVSAIGGAITWTPLTNYNFLGYATRTVIPVALGVDEGSSGPIEITLGWSRSPLYVLAPNTMARSSNADNDFVMTINRVDRYGLNFTLVADYLSYSPTWGMKFDA